jgi:hypothetical protein
MMQVDDRANIDPHTRTIIKALFAECRQPARLLELYYWSTEPELLPIIRQLAQMPARSRAALETFVRNTDPNTVHVEVESDNQVRLTRMRSNAPRRKQA